MNTPTEKMTTCDCCEREMCIEDLTDHHGEWLCSKCEDDMGLNDEEEESDDDSDDEEKGETCALCTRRNCDVEGCERDVEVGFICADCVEEEIPEYNDDGSDVKCYWCNARGCDTKIRDGVYIHKGCD